MTQRILIADDQEASRKGLAALVATWGYEVDDAGDGEEALAKAIEENPAVVITDLVMPKMDGLGLLKALQAELPFTMVIILTAHGTIETAVGATKDGAYDYLTKPVDVARLRLLVEKAIEKGEALREVNVLRRRVKAVWGHGRLVGTSKAMQAVFRQIDLAAPTSAPVLISGESGTGKELAARTLHELSPRSQGPFVAVNCAAIPDTLLESEIFGHEKGAFTGALDRRIGCFELAHQGTLFLDEISEMSPSLQAKFLRILQDGSLKRIGGKSELRVDVRVLAATNRDPAKSLKDGTLREDLYYRLNVFLVPLPPLRTRREDIPLLVQAFIEEFNAKYERKVRGVDEAALRFLVGHDWPGNVRQLRNAIERAVIGCASELITGAELPVEPGLDPATPSTAATGGRVAVRLKDVERDVILKTLASVGNNKTRAAELLGISLKTLHNKLNRYGV
ncbi:MAG TPA: sigma-54 dependent transcriptional regulator [Methylomirabilota bacterium]|nr:sigma-54 dependent transcriptional regulator [Methylomirabilota bacterium]